MNKEQFEALIAALGRIENRLPEPVAKPEKLPDEFQAGQRQALIVMLGVLDGWIEGAKENHEANRHRAEPLGAECWTQFDISEIKNMIRDAARQLGIQL